MTITQNIYEDAAFATNSSTPLFGKLTVTNNWYSGELREFEDESLT